MTLPTLPTLEELLHPESQPDAIREKATTSDDPLDPIHLFNMSWRRRDGSIPHVVLPKELTGTKAPIVVMSAKHYPTGSHKVGPAYSCLREYVLADQPLDPDKHTLVFPSTGNFGIGGAWVGPRVGFKSLVVLPEEMSAERFEKIRGYGADVIATPGCESNVKEIYDKVNELKQDDSNIILNQFALFGNYRYHHHVTGNAAMELVDELAAKGVCKRGGAFISAMGSAGTIAAGDRLKKRWSDLKIVGVEPVQCPTLTNAGYGGHAIEGIGDKHVTWIHNVRNMDAMICVEDIDTLKGLQLLQFGRDVLKKELGLDDSFLDAIDGMFGMSGICNIIGAIKTARHYDLSADDAVVTVATDGFDRYPSVMERLNETHGVMDDDEAKRRIGIFNSQPLNWIQEGTMDTRRRWHNQKYYTWVEQQGMDIPDLDALWEPSFWTDEADKVEALDAKTLARR